MFITHYPPLIDVTIPAELCGKPRGMDYVAYCKALSDSAKVKAHEKPIGLTLHVNPKEYVRAMKDLQAWALKMVEKGGEQQSFAVRSLQLQCAYDVRICCDIPLYY